jgi:serine/threonine-protein kinase RsbW
VSAPPVAGELAQLRQQLGAWLDATGVRADVRDDVLLAANEAAANVVQHATPSNSLTLRAAIHERLLTIEVVDTGNWDGQIRQRADSNSGRGLSIIRETVESFEIDTGPAGTTLRMYQAI